jgi:phospholipase C
MTEFAIDHVQHVAIIEPDGASITIAFGPPTPGRLVVFLFAKTVPTLPFAGPSPTPAPSPVPTVSVPIQPLLETRRTARSPADPLPLLRPGIGPNAGLGDPAIAALRRPIDTGPGGAGGIGDGGVFDPGDGIPPVPPPQTLDNRILRVEVINPAGDVVLSSMGPLDAELPAASGSGPIVGGGAAGGAAGGIIGGGRRWTLRVTNTSHVRANTTVNLLFHGQRPILSREIDLQFLNEKLDLIFNVPQPFQVAFRNREVAKINGISIQHTFVMLESSPAWRELHPDLTNLEHDLGARVFTEETGSYEISLRATIHDGELAFCADIAFPSFKGKIDVLNVISALGHDVVATIGNIVVDLTPADRPIITVRNLALDVFLVLRPRGVFLTAGPTFEVITRPRIDLTPGWATVVVDALMQVAFERFLPQAASRALHTNAVSLLGWLLGDRGREVTGSEEKLTLEYAGDAPQPPVLSTGDDFNTKPGPLEPGNLSKIDHIVVVMMENRSFDHMLGFLSLPASGNEGRVGLGRGDVDGLRGNETNPSDTRGNRQRVFSLGTPRPPTAGLDPAHETRGTKFRHDPGHSFRATAAQRGGYDITLPGVAFARRRDDGPEGPDDEPQPPPPPRVFRVGSNEGFVLDFARILSGRVSAFEEPLLRGEVMGYHPAGHVPFYRFLAEQYAVCDRWFASHPGHTWPNRFVALTGRLNRGRNGLPEVDNPPLTSFDPVETLTIFHHLDAAGVDWRYFEHDFAMVRLFSTYTFDRQHVVTIDHPEGGFFALAKQGKLPPVTYIEPDLTDVPPGGDDHPPADIAAGQAFLKRIYDALANGPANQWQKTLLIITYDEHGGFFDHVHPESRPLFNPQAPDPPGFAPLGVDPETLQPIDHYGFRVPAFVVSPWVPKASVGRAEYDHTSILKTIMARFLSTDPPDMGLRVLLANDVGPLLSLDRPRVIPRPPVVDFHATGQDVIAFRTGPPEEDFRTFLGAMRDRLRGPSVAAVARAARVFEGVTTRPR